MFLDGITIAMADDSPQQLQRNTAVALKYGMSILGKYSDGESLFNAITLKQIRLPQIVLLDIVMKGMTGVQVAQQLRAGGFINKIVLVTSMGQKNTSDPKKVGADYLLVKPFPDEWFLTAILSVLENETVPSGIEEPSSSPILLEPGQGFTSG